MKKLSLIACAIAMMGVCFTSCEKKPEPAVLANGFYVLGDAVGAADLNAADAASCQMANGVNEVTKELRDGMYEKYIILEGGKEFTFLEKKGELVTHWAATLTAQAIKTDGVDIEGGFAGPLKEGVATMKVEKTGLYHIVLDLNKDKQLDAAGGAQVVIAPVEWGVRGAMNSWGYTKFDEAAADGQSWTWKGVQLTAGAEFKFSHGNFWKIVLDVAEQVRAETSLGKDMVAGTKDNIKVEEGGVYDIVLTFKRAKGDIKNSYKMDLKKAGELILDPSTFVVGISGTMNSWGDPSGASLAKYDAAKSKVDDANTKAGKYVYQMTGMTFPAGSSFKFRANGEWLGLSAVTAATGVTLSEDADGNITGVDGTFDIEVTLVWSGSGMTSFSAAFTPGTPAATTNIKVTGKNIPADWAKVCLWAWNAQGNLFAAWPGQELTVNNGEVVYEFKDVVAPISVIFNNGDNGKQTENIENISADQVIDVTANLKK